MAIRKTVKTALRALRRNITRSALTVLGIVIGIAAVIAMMEIGKGSSGAISKTIASMGANNLLILPGAAASGGMSFGAGSALTLTEEDCQVILRDCPAVASASPIVRLGGGQAQLTYQDRNWAPGSILGVAPSYLDVREWTQMADGESFTDVDVRNSSRVCMIGQTILRELFDNQPAVGKELRIKNIGFVVVGVLSQKGANTFGMDQDDIVLAPWTTIKYRVSNSSSSSSSGTSSSSSTGTSGTSATNGASPYPGAPSVFPAPSAAQLADMPMQARFANVSQIIAAARSPAYIQPAIRQITEVLHERHRIRPGEPDDFNLRDMTETANALASTTTMMTNLLLCVALISLIVGGVGIMNIMLVSVTERTREIGLRMAVGARARDILRQFLAEAILLCVIGGVIGLLLGRGGSLMVQKVLRWPVEASMSAVIAAIAVSAGVGIIFGFYPAWKASRLDPIEALRYE